MLATLTELVEHLPARKLEQLVDRDWRKRLLTIAHGVKTRAIQPGLAEPRDGVMLSVRNGAGCRYVREVTKE